MKNIACILGFVVYLLAMVSVAEDYPESIAKIDNIKHDESALILSDQFFKISLNAKVFDHRGQLINRYGLKKGQWVSYVLSEDSASIEEIYIKPKGFTPSNRDEDER